MDKRKLRICSQFQDILDEKKALEENLEKVLNQVFTCVARVKNFSEEIKQKDCSLILSHELEVLKKLTEINYDLENIIEQSPLAVLKIKEKKYESDINVPEPSENIPESNTEVCVLGNPIPSQRAESPVDSSFNDVACSSAYISELISNNCNGDVSSNFSECDVQRELRDTLRKYSKKLGLNAKSISCMKDYYEKPSVSCVKDFYDKPSSSQNVPNYTTCASTSNFEMTTSEFEIPEKDTNTTINCNSDDKETSVVVSKVELPLKPVNLDTPELSIIENKNTPTCAAVIDAQNSIYCPDVSSMSSDVETEIFKSSSNDTQVFKLLNDNAEESNSTESSDLSSMENSTKNSQPYCQLTNDDLVLNPIDDNSNKTEDSIRQPTKIVYTAIEKLNNAQFVDRKEKALTKITPTFVPDLKLKPSEPQVIKNNFEEKNKLKKKKNKKKKNVVRDENFYELRPKPAPVVGQDCAFSHIESPSEFYIHIVDDESFVVDMLTEQINEYFQGTVSDYTSKEEASAGIGLYCFVFISQYNGWYRAKVINWYLENKSDDVYVQLVDYGNKRRVTYKSLRKMTKGMAEYPMLAIRCHLPLMYPPTSTYFNRLTEWPPEAVDALVNLSGLFLAENEDNKFFKVVYAQEAGDSVAIDLYNSQEVNEEQTVGQILLDLGFAVQILENPDENNLELEEFLQDIDSLETADNINEAVMGYDPRDEARICRFTKPDGTCFKGKNCKLEHIPFSKDGFTTDQEIVYREAMDSLLLPSTGEVIMLLITEYKDACNFFAQIVRKPHKEKHRSLEYVIDEELYTLLGTMNNAKTVKTYETFKIPPALGEVVIAKHRYNKKWLRAVVRDRIMGNNDETDEYQVFIVDFGDYIKVPFSDLRKIKPQYLQLPFQAIECYIHNYKAKVDCDKEKVKEFFYRNLLFHNFVAVAMSASLPLKVGIKTFNGFDISKTLVEKGFAEESIYDKNLIDGYPLVLY